MTGSILYQTVLEKLQSGLTRYALMVTDVQRAESRVRFRIVGRDWSEPMGLWQEEGGELILDLSHVQDSEHLRRIRPLLEDLGTSVRYHFGFPVIGTDESGKGDYFGPLVVAGILVTEDNALQLRKIGVRDSKQLSISNVLALSAMIREICSTTYSIIEISPERYNDLYGQFRAEGKNLNTLLAWGHAKAIEEILVHHSCGTAVSDQFADPRYIISRLQERGRTIRLIQLPGAERTIAVAAASILARARFLEKMEKVSAQYQISFPRGASPKVIDVARQFVRLHGPDQLRKVAKLHFKTTKSVIPLLSGEAKNQEKR